MARFCCVFFAAIPYLRGRFSQCAIYQFITSAYSTNLMLPHTDNLIGRAGLEAKEVRQIKRLCACLALPKKCSRIKPCPLPSTGTDCICFGIGSASCRPACTRAHIFLVRRKDRCWRLRPSNTRLCFHCSGAIPWQGPMLVLPILSSSTIRYLNLTTWRFFQLHKQLSIFTHNPET